MDYHPCVRCAESKAGCQLSVRDLSVLTVKVADMPSLKARPARAHFLMKCAQHATMNATPFISSPLLSPSTVAGQACPGQAGNSVVEQTHMFRGGL